MDAWLSFAKWAGIIFSTLLGLSGAVALVASLLRNGDSKRLTEILKDELGAQKETGIRLLDERNEYKDKYHSKGVEAQALQTQVDSLKDHADLRPLMELQTTFYKEQSTVNGKLVEMLDKLITKLDA